MRLPSAKERETRTQFKFNVIVPFPQIRSGDVSNLITIVYVASRERQQRLNKNAVNRCVKSSL